MSNTDIVARLQDSLSFVEACRYPDGLECHCDPSVGHRCELCTDKANLFDAIKEIEGLRKTLLAASVVILRACEQLPRDLSRTFENEAEDFRRAATWQRTPEQGEC